MNRLHPFASFVVSLCLSGAALAQTATTQPAPAQGEGAAADSVGDAAGHSGTD